MEQWQKSDNVSSVTLLVDQLILKGSKVIVNGADAVPASASMVFRPNQWSSTLIPSAWARYPASSTDWALSIVEPRRFS